MKSFNPFLNPAGPRFLNFLWLNMAVISGALLMFFLTVLAFFPGGMSPDSITQVAEASTGLYSDGHPPIMAFLWRVLFSVWDNAGVLFVFHNACYWLFWCLFPALLFRDWKIKLSLLAIAALPSFWSQTIAVWKDTELSLCVLWAYFLVVLLKEDENSEGSGGYRLRPVLFFFVVLLLFYSQAVRLNSLPLLLPLAWYFFARSDQKALDPGPWLKAAVFLSAGFISIQVFNYTLLKAQRTDSFQVCKVFDIAGVFARTKDMTLLPPYWKAMNGSISPEIILRQYVPQSVDPLVRTGLVHLTADPRRLNELNEKWLRAMDQYPRAYLQHRWLVFKELLRLGKVESFYPFQLEVIPNNLGLLYGGDAALKGRFLDYFYFFQNSIFFKGWAYLAMVSAILVFLLLRRYPKNLFITASFCSALSALLYGGAYFFCSVSSDFRYWYPVVTLSVFSAIMLLRGQAAAPGGDRGADEKL
jgi:hypothetical protein